MELIMKEEKMKTIKAKILTQESFSKYGFLVERNTNVAPDSKKEHLNFWGDQCNLKFDTGATTGYLEIFRQDDFAFNQLERHLTGPEIFIPVGGVCLMPFAPVGDIDNLDEKPDVEKIEVFIIDGTQGIVIETGVWHFVPLPITSVMRFMLTIPKNIDDDMDIRSFSTIRITL